MASKTTDADSGTRSFKYPYYPLASAMRVATAIKDLGGARTPVKKSLLAKQLGTSDSAAAFVQGLTSAKTFGVIDGHGDYSLTEIAKRYFFPTTETDKSLALLDAFGAPPAFSELLRRFDGDRLPSRDILGNILHRDLGVPDSWKDRVGGLFASAAQEVGVIDSQGYLRYDAARHSPSEPPPEESSSPLNAGQEKGTVREHVQRESPRAPIMGKVHWQYKSIEVLTPEDLDYGMWQKLEGYVKLLEPPK